jgi:hypothetical protein
MCMQGGVKVAGYNRRNELMKQIWIREEDKKKIEKLSKQRKLLIWEMVEKMLKNYKEG